MKKNFLLTMVLALLSTATAWAGVSLGSILSSAELNSITTPTKIVIKNLSGTNSAYFAGTSNQTAIDNAVLVWEPVTEGTAGTYYLRTTDATNGYIQNGTGTNSTVTLGTKEHAQVFVTTVPAVPGNNDPLVGADESKLVRFVQNGTSTWLNVNKQSEAPRLGNTGTGAWTVHNEYAIDVEPYTLLKSPSGTYLSFTAPSSTSTQASFRAEGTKLIIEQTDNGYTIKEKGTENYLAKSGNDWDVTTSTTPYYWSISEPDGEGYVTITKADNSSHRLGHDESTSAGTGIFANVGVNCNKWLLEEYNTGAVTYTIQIQNATGANVSVTYNGNAIAAGETIVVDDMVNTSFFSATDIEGYWWSVEVNQYLKTITIVYKKMYDGSYYLKSSIGDTYLSLELPNSTSTQASFQATGTEFYIEPIGNNYYITQLNSNPVKYFTVSSSNAWDVTTSTTAFEWLISEPDANGLVDIAKASTPTHFLGHDSNRTAGTGVYANITSGCNKWQLVKVGPLTYTFVIENPSGKTVSATYNGNAIANDATVEIDGRVNTSLFSANDIEGYSWSVKLDPTAKKITLVYEKKYNWSIVGAPNGVTITYNSNPIADGGVVGVAYDSKYLSVTDCPGGYTWEVTRDDVNKIVAITFTQLQGEENPAAVVALINRIGGDAAADKFKFVLDPSLNYAQEVFVIDGEEGKILIKGSTISAITTGIGWYLNNYAHINIAWNSLNEKTVSGDAYADLSNIPVPTEPETRTCDAQYRYYLNTCTFGYSMTSWTWKRWQQEIDWMALHGINMPLQLVGMEEVWRKFLTMEENGKRKYGYTDDAAKAFVAGPAFIAWWAMNNLEGWGGTAAGTKSGGTWQGAGGVQDDKWYERQKALAQQICARQRELGMQPVLPGWSGMVPTNFASKSGYATRGNGGNWAGDFVRPLLLAVSNSNYAEIAADYYACLEEVMGESKYYSMDPFHEGGGAGTMEDYQALYEAMEQAKPGSQWVIQQWQWSETQRYSLTAVPAGRLIVLDLFSDGSPAFNSYNGYAPQDAVFCAIPNFGGRSGLMGRLQNVTDNYFKFKQQYSSIKGIGTAPEAIEQTPVTYDLIYQLPWMGTKPDVAAWVDNYAVARYGVDNEEIKEAWSLLRQGPLNYGADGIQGPVEDVWAARPNLNANPASAWGKTLTNAMGTYNAARQQMLIDATYKLLAHSGDITPATIYESNYLYDIVEFGGAVIADYAYYLLKGINDAKTSEGTSGATYIARKNAFLQLILDMDTFRGTNLNFRLGKWTQEARAAAAEAVALGATSANADWYEYNNARTILSTWSSPNTNLNDYSYRSWQGLMKDLYYPRWKHYFDNNCTSAQYGYFEWNWAHGKEHYVGQTAVSSTALTAGQAGHTDSYTRDPEGSTITEANKMLGKYIIPVNLPDGTTYYAYRCLANDPSIKIVATEGDVLDLSGYFNFGNLDGVTVGVTSDVIDGTATDLLAVAIKGDACGDADSVTKTATLALSDGTTITFTIVVNTSEMNTAKEELAALIEEMKGLTAQVGTFDPAGVLNKVTLTTTQGSNGYIWTNAQSAQEGPLANLIDGQISTHFHTDYSGGNATSGTHYIAVDLGEGTVLGNFKFDYTTRNGGSGDFPDKIVVYGSDNNSNYVKIAEITEPAFPQATNTKWELGEVLYTEKRYLRFNVYAERGYWHMSEFNIYQTSSTADVLDKYNDTELTDDFAAEKYNVLLDAINAYDYCTTTAGVNAAQDALQAAYDALKAEVDKLTPEDDGLSEAKAALYAVIEKMEALTNAVANYSYRTALPLQTGSEGEAFYISSNADQNTGGGDNDGGGIAALVDNNDGTFFHTRWGGNVVDEPHYIQVDLGASDLMDSFEFTYKPRSGSPAPTAMTIYGSNDGVTFTEVLATIESGLPAHNSGVEYDSELIDSKGYRYLRFAVTGSSGPGNAQYGGQYFFGMLEFDLYRITPSADVFSYLEEKISDNDALVAYVEMLEATDVYENGTTVEQVETAATDLQSEYEKLLVLLQGALPVKITLDEADPVLYKIIIKRAEDNSKVLRYDNTDSMVAVGNSAENKTWQAWYFMSSVNGVTIHPYNADGKVLSADNTSNGAAKVWAVEKGSKSFYEWKFVARDNGYYNIQAHDGSNYFSNNGGESHKMGFWSNDAATDGGSLFKFVDATFENENPRYYQLKDVKEALGTVYSGTSVGLYSTESVAAYNEKITAADALITAGSATSSSVDCYAAYKALRDAKAALVYNAPDPNKVYYIVSTATNDYCRGKYLHTNLAPTQRTSQWGTNTYNQPTLLFDAVGDITQLSLAAFQFVETGVQGQYKIKNLHTDLYMKTFTDASQHMVAESGASTVVLAGIADGQVTLKIGNNSPMHAQNDYGVIVAWGASVSNASTWTINEATNLDELYKLTVSAEGVTTLNLAFNVQLPEGVTAYDFVEGDIVVSENDDTRNEFTLTQVAAAGEVLAKNTPVIIKAAPGEYNLTAVLSDENVKNGTTGSVLRGNYWQTTIGTAEVNYLPAIAENKLVFNKVDADDTAVTANTVWAVLSADKGETIYEYVEPEPETPIIYPEVGKVYHISNFVSNTSDEHKTHFIALNGNLGIDFPTSVEADNKNAWWVCTSANEETHKYKFVSALGTAAFGWKGVAENALEYTLTPSTTNVNGSEGSFTMTNPENANLALTTEGYNNSGKAAFNQASNGGTTQSEHWSTDWFITEVEDAASQVSFSKLIPSGNSFATMYLPYDVEIPAGVYAYYAGEIVAASQTSTKKVIDLRSVDAVIPKNTAVLLYREDRSDEGVTYDFALSTGDAEAIVDNLFEGKVMTSAVEAPTGFRVFLLLNYNEKEAFYWMAAEYNDSLQAGDTHVKCDANKAYLKIDVTTMGKASSYSFRYDGTTGIEDIEDVDNVESGDIYDLQGRKVTKPVKGGIYIKNGVKVIM